MQDIRKFKSFEKERLVVIKNLKEFGYEQYILFIQKLANPIIIEKEQQILSNGE